MQKHSGMSINITNHYDFDPAIPLPRIISYSASMCRMICTMLFTAVPCSSICNSKCMPLLGLNEFLYIIPENTTPLSEWESSSLADERQSSRYIRNPDSEAPLQTSGIRILRITKTPRWFLCTGTCMKPWSVCFLLMVTPGLTSFRISSLSLPSFFLNLHWRPFLIDHYPMCFSPCHLPHFNFLASSLTPTRRYSLLTVPSIKPGNR